MKLNDVKHNHSLTDLLKILIFSILMMIPFIDVAIRCAYVVCNKNAYQSYSGFTNTNETIEYTSVDTYSDLVVGQWYNLNTDQKQFIGTSQFFLYFDDIQIIKAPSNNLSNQVKSIQIGYYSNANNWRFWYYDQNNNNLGNDIININENNINFNFRFTNLSPLNLFDNFKHILSSYEVISPNTNTLDNVFDYSVNKLTTSELYTWTQQTAIYTGVQTMCTHLGINNTIIPLLLVYWFILTIIYIIIDIVLKLFTMLTHAIGSKTA